MQAPSTRVSATLADVLSAGRPHFNKRVAETRHQFATFDTAAFAAFLRDGVDSIAKSVASVSPERTAQVILAVYDMALALVAQGLAGPNARSSAVDSVWILLAPHYARLISDAPVEVLGALTNAAINLAKAPGARVDEWLKEMQRLATHIDSVPRLHAVGQIVAWRSGLAHFREGALHAADNLPEPLALLALHAEVGTWQEVRDACRANPWWSPDAKRREAARRGVDVGAFTGFGGTFAQPPEVRATAQGFVTRSGDRFQFLIADAFGAVLLPANEAEFSQAQTTGGQAEVKLAGARLTLGDRHIDIDLPAEGLSIAGNAHSVAVTSPYTHAIRVVPRQ
jgi:hypothetical protein